MKLRDWIGFACCAAALGVVLGMMFSLILATPIETFAIFYGAVLLFIIGLLVASPPDRSGPGR